MNISRIVYVWFEENKQDLPYLTIRDIAHYTSICGMSLKEIRTKILKIYNTLKRTRKIDSDDIILKVYMLRKKKRWTKNEFKDMIDIITFFDSLSEDKHIFELIEIVHKGTKEGHKYFNRRRGFELRRLRFFLLYTRVDELFLYKESLDHVNSILVRLESEKPDSYAIPYVKAALTMLEHSRNPYSFFHNVVGVYPEPYIIRLNKEFAKYG